MMITELRTETFEWDAFVRASTDGSPFHLTAWKRAVEETFGHRPHYLMAKHRGAVAGVLPLFEVNGLPGRRALVSVPYGVYGGICASSDEARQALLEAATALGRQRGAAYVVNPGIRPGPHSIPAVRWSAVPPSSRPEGE